MQIFGLDYSYAAELQNFFGSNLAEDVSKVPAPSSFCEAREKLQHGVFIELNSTLVNAFYQESEANFWMGFRLGAVDGTTIHVPDTPENVEEFGGWDSAKSEPGDICPKARISLVYDPLNKLIIDALMGPIRVGEEPMAFQHLEKATPNDLMIYDRGYPSYELFRRHEDSWTHYCARLPVKQYTRLIGDLLESEEDDCEVYYTPQGNGRSKCKEEGLCVEPIKIRLIKIELPTGETEVLATNVFDKRLSVNSFKELYHLRWGVEEEYKRLKCRVELEAFSGMKTEFVYQDFYADVVRLNMTSLVSMDAREELKQQGKKKKYSHVPNMSLALSQLGNYLEALFNESENQLKIVGKNLTAYLVKRSLSWRPGRKYPRKRKPVRSGYSMGFKRAC